MFIMRCFAYFYFSDKTRLKGTLNPNFYHLFIFLFCKKFKKNSRCLKYCEMHFKCYFNFFYNLILFLPFIRLEGLVLWHVSLEKADLYLNNWGRLLQASLEVVFYCIHFEKEFLCKS